MIKSFSKIMFPGLAGAFDAVQVTNVITPFSMTDEKDTVNNVTNAVAGKIASRKTGVERLGWVRDVDKELEEIDGDEMNDLTEPTF